MRDIITAYLEGEGRNVLTAADAQRLGCTPSVVRGMERSRLILRVARGAYVSAKEFNPPKEHPAAADVYALQRHRHLLRLDALLRSYGDKVAASHQSAVLAWGLPTQHASLERVHLLHVPSGRTTRRFRTFTIHTCELEDVITTHKGRRLVTVALAVIGQAMSVGVMPGVAAIDAALVNKLVTAPELTDMVKRLRHTPRLGLAREAVRLADGLAESPGETRLRLVLVKLGIAFVAQHWVCTEAGNYFRVDFYLPELGVILEYDGAVKYGAGSGGPASITSGAHHLGGHDRAGRDSDPASAGRRALVAEKAREDELRLAGFGVGRITAADLSPSRVTAVIAAARQQAQPRALRRPAAPPPWADAR